MLNGEINRDEEEKVDILGTRGASAIDYVIVDEKTMEEIKMLEIEDRIDSDHHLEVIWSKGGNKRRGRKEEGGREVIKGYKMRRKEISLKRG